MWHHASNRMPAILEPEHFDAWLDTDTTKPADAAKLLRPYADEPLEIRAVSTRGTARAMTIGAAWRR